MSEKSAPAHVQIVTDTDVPTETPETPEKESRFNKKLLMKVAGYTTGALAFLTAGYLLGADDPDEELEDEDEDALVDIELNVDENITDSD